MTAQRFSPGDVVAALDIGGTKTAAALVTSSGEILESVTSRTPGAEGPEAILATAISLIEQLQSQRPETVAAVGVGSAGVIDADQGIVLAATDALPGWAGTDLRGHLASRLRLPVTVINDVHAHAIGEARTGPASEAASVLSVAVGTGIGGSFVINGRPLLGAHFVAGHVGHQPSPYAVGLACSCGGAGHLEALASGPSLAAEYLRRTGDAVSDLQDVARRARAGDGTARDVIRRGGEAVGSAIGGLINVLDPDVVVVGGGVSQIGALWWEALTAAAAHEVLPAAQTTPIVLSTQGSRAALVGAAALAWEMVQS